MKRSTNRIKAPRYVSTLRVRVAARNSQSTSILAAASFAGIVPELRCNRVNVPQRALAASSRCRPRSALFPRSRRAKTPQTRRAPFAILLVRGLAAGCAPIALHLGPKGTAADRDFCMRNAARRSTAAHFEDFGRSRSQTSLSPADPSQPFLPFSKLPRHVYSQLG